MSPASTIANRASDFRNAFDKSYAVPHAKAADDKLEDFLTIRISGDPCAIRLREISGLAKGRKVVACPSQTPEFLGIAGVRGSLVCVYSLPALLGYAIEVQQAPWLLLCSGEELIGFSFAEFEGFASARSSQIHSAEHPAEPNTGVRGSTTQILSSGGEIRAIVSIPSLKRQIQKHSSE